MKVYIGKYPRYFNTYKLADALCFWVKDVTDEFGSKHKPDWVHKFGEFLTYGNIEPDPTPENPVVSLSKERKVTWLYKFVTMFNRERKVNIRIDRYDTWNMNDTLALIILPMLKQLKETKQGSPFVDDEDVPEELRSTSAPPKKNEWDTDDNFHKRWNWVLDEIIFAFENSVDDSWEDQFYHDENEELLEKVVKWSKDGKPELFELVTNREPGSFDREGYTAYANRIQNGFVLFGKYYRNLWD